MATTYDTNLSELDSLSDSDWLDIASSRGGETDDDGALSEAGSEPDSLASGDEDAASASGTDGVDHWEGLNDEGPSRSSSSSSLPTPLATNLPNAGAVLLYRHNAPRLVLSPLARNVLATEEDLAEDERVQSALDQSMVSTLSTSSSQSRSSPELRLSFPDPLTSSRATLVNSSYEDVHESLSADDADADTEPDSGIADNDGTLTYIPSEPSVNAGVPPMPVVQQREASPVKSDLQPSVGKSIREHMRSPQIPVILVALSMALGYVMWGVAPTAQPTVSIANDTLHRVSNATLLKHAEASASALALIPTTKPDVVAISTSSISAVSIVPKFQNALAPVPSTSTGVTVNAQECAAASSRRIKMEEPQPVASTSAVQLSFSTSNGLSVVPIAPSSISVYTTTSSVLPLKLDIKGKGKATAYDNGRSLGAWIGGTLEEFLRSFGLGEFYNLKREVVLTVNSLGAWIGGTLEEFMRSFGLGEFYSVKRDLMRGVDSLGDTLARAAARTEAGMRSALTWAQGVLPAKVREAPPLYTMNVPSKEELRARRTRAKDRARVLRENVVEHVKVRARDAQGKARIALENIQAHRNERRAKRETRKVQRRAERKDRQANREKRKAERKAKRV